MAGGMGVMVMNKYEQMSDDEIAEAVLLANGYEFAGLDSVGVSKRYSKNGDCKDVSNCDFAIRDEFDPCNDPADAWPIIIENEIVLYPDADGGGHAAIRKYDDDRIATFSHEYKFYDAKNVLRAAMTCFLMMKEMSNERSI